MTEPENEVTTEEKENSNCGLGLEEGACGGIQGLRPSTPFSDGDNVSMEVGFSEGSSHHASDISSVSYQNLLDDDVSTQNLSRRGSEESVDSYLPDYCDDIRGDGTAEGGASYSDRISDRISAPIQMRGDQIYVATDDLSIGLKKTSHSVISDPGPDLQVDHPRMSSLPQNSDSISVQDSFRKHELVVTMRDQQRSKSLPPADSKEQIVKKRSSLEIRNNIPVYGEVKNYEKDIDKLVYSNQGAKPKIKKQSPGLACRVEETTVTDQIEIDQDMDKATKIISDLIQVSKANSVALNAQCKKLNQEMEKQTAMFNGENKVDDDHTNVVQPTKTDVENEYEYVKYSRIQEGNSYVGKRLAYSSSESDETKRQNIDNDNSNLMASSQEGTPEKFSSHNVANTDNIQSNLSEDMLTEIPLNGPDSSNVLDDRKLFTLSPENTECDSVEIESVTSEGDKSPVGMPIVEDGLSSSQTSDVEDSNSNNKPSSTQSTPRKQLQQKQQKEIEKKLYGMECAVMKPREMDAEAIIDDLKLKREALDNAIHDIKMAIQKSKGVALEAPYNGEEDSEDPVWIKRDDNIIIPRGESTQEILHSREELEHQAAAQQQVAKESPSAAERQSDAEKCTASERPATMDNQVATERQITPDRQVATERQITPDRHAEAMAERQAVVDKMTKEHEEVYHTEQSKLLSNQYKRSNGKIYQTPKGYDSDDEDDDGVQYTRRNKGKKYSQVPRNESTSHSESSHYSDGDVSSVRKIDSVSMYGDTNMFAYTQDSHSERRNSESQCSSEDFCSDSESGTKHAYIQKPREGDFDTDEETDRLLEKQYQGNQYVDIPELTQPPVNRNLQAEKRRSRAKEVQINDPENPSVLIEGVLFRARYLGSTQLISEGQPSKAMRMMQAQEAVGRIKAPEGENQPSTEVDLFVSTEKIMVLNTDLQEIMMDHSLRTISYIADIGDILVLMARRRLIGSPGETDSMRKRKQAKMLCHVFETDEAQLIAQSIGQAFQVAYMEFLKANGIEDPGLMKEIDYQDVLNQQEIYGEELNLFANKEMHKEVIVPKMKGELLGVVIVESGWGSMVPTVVLANMSPNGPSARCGQLNIGDQIISVNGISLVGLPLSTCQTYIKSAKNQTVVKLTVVPCPPVVEVCIKRPDVKYQLGFSVQNGVICSLLRGGIAERGGVRVGHRIIEINSQSVVAVPHEKIVALLANSVGEIHMKTMPTSIFRLLTGQETPHYL